jgi:hypothetical protein
MPDSQQTLEALKRAYNEVFPTPNGQKVLDDLKKIAFFNSTTINEIPHIMGFNEGQRAVILHIISRMNLDMLKLKENNDDGQS